MDETIGYKRPPLASRFKKGQSGNPRGRPQGQLNLKTDLVDELSELIRINEGGKSRSITKQRALLKSLTARGIKGDSRASTIILKMVMDVLEPTSPHDGAAQLSPADDEALTDFLETYRKTAQETKS